MNLSNVVMVPLDGSPASEVALPWAIHLAKRAGAVIRLVGVHAPPAVLLDGETLVGSVIPDEPVRQRETEYFAGVQERVRANGVQTSADLLDGSVIPSLAEYARSLRPKWIVMLCHARGPVARFFVGETSSEFLRESPCPVLLVHPANQAVVEVRRVLVPLDGSSLAERMLEPAAEFAKVLGAEIALLTISDHADLTYLPRQAERLRPFGVSSTMKVVTETNPADPIAADANGFPGTVVALATHGRGGLSKLMWGSVADAVIRKTTGPVLIQKPG
jgi:nucleotide-binding universal stress UspA family protein